MNDDRSKSTSGWSLTAVVMLPLVYVLSIGPVVAFMEHYHVSWLRDSLEKFYAPVFWLHDHTSLKGPLESYGRFWGFK